MSEHPNGVAGRRGLIVLLAGILLGVVSGCSDTAPPWNSRSIDGLVPDLAFDLIDDRGHSVTAADYPGRVRLLYFGFTHCPDICPTTLATLATAVHSLGADAHRVRVLFVSVDPWRDTPDRLGSYARRFGPEVVGLTGEVPALATLARRYRVVFDPSPPADREHDAVKHSNAIFAFDGRGRARLLMREDSGALALAADLKRLVDEDSDTAHRDAADRAQNSQDLVRRTGGLQPPPAQNHRS